MSSRSCENIFAFVAHCMLRPDNFFTRKSGNTLGRFLMSLNNVEEQTLLSVIKVPVMQKCWHKSIKKPGHAAVSPVTVWQILNYTLYRGIYNLMEPFITFRLCIFFFFFFRRPPSAVRHPHPPSASALYRDPLNNQYVKRCENKCELREIQFIDFIFDW